MLSCLVPRFASEDKIMPSSSPFALQCMLNYLIILLFFSIKQIILENCFNPFNHKKHKLHVTTNNYREFSATYGD